MEDTERVMEPEDEMLNRKVSSEYVISHYIHEFSLVVVTHTRPAQDLPCQHFIINGKRSVMFHSFIRDY